LSRVTEIPQVRDERAEFESAPVSAPSVRAREDARLFEDYSRERDPALREALMRRFLPLAWHLAARYSHGGERDDVRQVAVIGLLKAIDRYDPYRGIAFSSFAMPTIIGEVKRYFRDLGWTVRVPRDIQELSLRLERVTEGLSVALGRSPTPDEIAQQCGVTVEQVLEARASATAHRAISLDQPAHGEDEESTLTRLPAEEPEFARVEDADELEQLLSVLPPRERRVLMMRFCHDMLQREIAEAEGVSQMQVSRMLSQSLATLRDLHGRPQE